MEPFCDDVQSEANGSSVGSVSQASILKSISALTKKRKADPQTDSIKLLVTEKNDSSVEKL